jgi:hypothetical protein
VRVVGRDDESDDKQGHHVQAEHSDKDVFGGSGDVSTRVLGLGSGDRERLYPAKGVDGVDQGEPETALP